MTRENPISFYKSSSSNNNNNINNNNNKINNNNNNNNLRKVTKTMTFMSLRHCASDTTMFLYF